MNIYDLKPGDVFCYSATDHCIQTNYVSLGYVIKAAQSESSGAESTHVSVKLLDYPFNGQLYWISQDLWIRYCELITDPDEIVLYNLQRIGT
jgi:hypothetical protein